MYAVGDSLPTEELREGTYLLSGPAMSGKYKLLLDFVVEGIDHGDAVLFATANESAGPIYGDIEARIGTLPDDLRVVDCVAELRGAEGRDQPERVEYVSSPADLTGIGIGVAGQLRRVAETEAGRTRICFYSLSTLLMYAEFESVFRFFHVLSGRVDSIGALGLFALDPTTHDQSTVNTLKQLVDGVIEVRLDNGTQGRVEGAPGGNANGSRGPSCRGP